MLLGGLGGGAAEVARGSAALARPTILRSTRGSSFLNPGKQGRQRCFMSERAVVCGPGGGGDETPSLAPRSPKRGASCIGRYVARDLTGESALEVSKRGGEGGLHSSQQSGKGNTSKLAVSNQLDFFLGEKIGARMLTPSWLLF